MISHRWASVRTSLRNNNRDIQTTQRSFHQYQFSILLHLKFDITRTNSGLRRREVQPQRLKTFVL
jgi:hypothetical protein